MATQHGIIYKDKAGRVILLTINFLMERYVRRRIFNMADDPYRDLCSDSADLVEVLDDNEAINMAAVLPIRGVSFKDSAGQPSLAYEAIEHALAANPQALEEMLAAAESEAPDCTLI
jgi:hypothetical protein